MALPIDIEELLRKNRIESNRIEFKLGWNPSAVYRSICAFANDLDNLGGGYVVIGVEERNGVAVRPVRGIPATKIDGILKQMVGFNNLMDPYYLPRTSVEEVDGKHILVIWIPSGCNRPYSVPKDVRAKAKINTFYIRSGSSSIEAKGEVLDELRNLANRIPFDDRGNPAIELSDLSPLLLQDYLRRVNSKLEKELRTENFSEILDQLDLYDGPVEKRLLKNVAAMMFCEKPEKFFPTSRVEIVIFPEGRTRNPNNMVEIPAIRGSVPQMIRATLDYLRLNVIKEKIIKPKDDEHSIRYFNYPYQAFEEAVVNALYHRDYQVREPVEITIEPSGVTILSFSGPDRSISAEAIKAARVLRTRRYRNRRLGDFLKELKLSEGRSTGIPTIQKELAKNCSAAAAIETDADRTFFSIEIPVNGFFEGEICNIGEGTCNIEGETCNIGEGTCNIEGETCNIGEGSCNIGESLMIDRESFTGTISLSQYRRDIKERLLKMYFVLANNDSVSSADVSQRIGCSRFTATRLLQRLDALNLIEGVSGYGKGRFRLKRVSVSQTIGK